MRPQTHLFPLSQKILLSQVIDSWDGNELNIKVTKYGRLELQTKAHYITEVSAHYQKGSSHYFGSADPGKGGLRNQKKRTVSDKDLFTFKAHQIKSRHSSNILAMTEAYSRSKCRSQEKSAQQNSCQRHNNYISIAPMGLGTCQQPPKYSSNFQISNSRDNPCRPNKSPLSRGASKALQPRKLSRECNGAQLQAQGHRHDPPIDYHAITSQIRSCRLADSNDPNYQVANHKFEGIKDQILSKIVRAAKQGHHNDFAVQLQLESILDELREAAEKIVQRHQPLNQQVGKQNIYEPCLIKKRGPVFSFHEELKEEGVNSNAPADQSRKACDKRLQSKGSESRGQHEQELPIQCQTVNQSSPHKFIPRKISNKNGSAWEKSGSECNKEGKQFESQIDITRKNNEGGHRLVSSGIPIETNDHNELNSGGSTSTIGCIKLPQLNSDSLQASEIENISRTDDSQMGINIADIINTIGMSKDSANLFTNSKQISANKLGEELKKNSNDSSVGDTIKIKDISGQPWKCEPTGQPKETVSHTNDYMAQIIGHDAESLQQSEKKGQDLKADHYTDYITAKYSKYHAGYLSKQKEDDHSNHYQPTYHYRINDKYYAPTDTTNHTYEYKTAIPNKTPNACQTQPSYATAQLRRTSKPEFKFRRKEEVVKHLVETKIVERESNSIEF